MFHSYSYSEPHLFSRCQLLRSTYRVHANYAILHNSCVGVTSLGRNTPGLEFLKPFIGITILRFAFHRRYGYRNTFYINVHNIFCILFFRTWYFGDLFFTDWFKTYIIFRQDDGAVYTEITFKFPSYYRNQSFMSQRTTMSNRVKPINQCQCNIKGAQQEHTIKP